MRMNELTENERDVLDKLNCINLKLVDNETQSLWNICWGYLHNKFSSSLIQESEEVIKQTLQEVNSQAPKVVTLDNSICTPEKEKLYTQKDTKVPVKHKFRMDTLF